MHGVHRIIAATSAAESLSRGKAECMHASIACLLLYEDYVWVSLGNAMKAKAEAAANLKQSKANRDKLLVENYTTVTVTKDTASDTGTLQNPVQNQATA